MASLSLSSPPSLSSSHHTVSTHLLLHTPNSIKFRTFPHRATVSVKVLSSLALTQDDLKKLAADKAVDFVRSSTVLSLGIGSTAAFVVTKLGELLKSSQLEDIVGVPTSNRTEEQARSLGIPLFVLDDNPRLDLAFDGTDEVDPDLNLVKGPDGALLREKMVEAASDWF